MGSGASLLLTIGSLAAIAIIAGVILLYSRSYERRRRESMARIYTEETVGTVVAIDNQSSGRGGKGGRARVRYTVDGHEYILTEQLKLVADHPTTARTTALVLNKRTAAGAEKVGDTVRVCYRKDDPSRAILPDNQGLMRA